MDFFAFILSSTFIFFIPLTILLSIVIKTKRKKFNLKHADFGLQYEYVLHNKTHFYEQLPPNIKIKFRQRLAVFIKGHDFEGHEGLNVTEDMKTLISAAAIHLTLGLDDFEFDDFRKIIVYPDVYYSGYSKTTNRGETNPHGIIALT